MSREFLQTIWTPIRSTAFMTSPSTPNGSGGSPTGLEASPSNTPINAGPESGLPLASDSLEKDGFLANISSIPPVLFPQTLTTQSPQAIPSPIVLITIVGAIAIMLTGLVLDNGWFGLSGAVVALVSSTQILWRSVRLVVLEVLSARQRALIIALVGTLLGAVCLIRFSPVGWSIRDLWLQLNWDAVGAIGEVIGAVGQILIAIIAVYVAWRQYVISKDLTIQQNIITQQQTIDAYFQGISELVLDAEGLLEDWPQERAIAEGRTAAILGSIDASGKAKVLRFLSRCRLLSPLRRDRHLGRAILDGMGGYEEDRDQGVRVIDLGVMLAGADLSGNDLRWTDLSDANLIRANLMACDLVRTNLARTILCEANLMDTDLMGTRFFYGKKETASPRSRIEVANYISGEFTGAVVEDADFTNAQRLSDDQRYYCCAWGGAKTRETIPGGCEGIPNKLGR